MPVIPNFSSFAPTPNLASSFLGGRASAQRDTEIENQSRQANNALAMQQQQLAQAAQQTQMEMQAKQSMFQQEQLRKEQEMAIEGQYKQQMIGLRQIELEGNQAKLQQEAMQAAQQFSARQSIEQEMAKPGADPLKIYSQFAPSAGVAPGSFADLLSNQSRGAHIPKMMDLGKGLTAVERSRDVWSVFDENKREISESNSQLSRERFEDAKERGYAGLGLRQEALDQGRARLGLSEKAAAATQSRSQIKILQDQLKQDEDGKNFYTRMIRGTQLKPAQMEAAKKYAAKLEKLAEMTDVFVSSVDAIAGDQGTATATVPAPAKSDKKVELKAGEAVQTLGNGRKAVFDTTKNPPEFLRYAD